MSLPMAPVLPDLLIISTHFPVHVFYVKTPASYTP